MTDISVILTLYKRPENLKLQLDAILNQTIKPKEIMLFQDGTNDGTIVKIPEEIKNKFDIIEVSPTNVGVWGRFRFAQKANSEYVCVFDDDTIPGTKWFENCINNMNEQEGIYGTIGILMKKPENYPLKDYIRVGWANPNKTRKEVDFVGHSWFLKREWLQYLFKDTEELQSFKIAGEDMSLSAQAQKYAKIRTFIPPHPLKNQELWGSNKNFAEKLGTSKAGISMNNNNLKTMNKTMNILLKNGFETLSIRNPEYVEHMFNCVNKAKTLTKLLPFKHFRHKIRTQLNEYFYN